jgi:hypothetical protein
MRSWPSWLAIVLGGLMAIVALWSLFITKQSAVLPALLLPGSILLAAGLHSLQATYDSWCDCASCMGAGCECDHCGACAQGECCGKCDCMDGGDGHTH